MLIDSHSHVNFKDFDEDRDEVIRRALDSGTRMINVGTDYESSKKAIEIAKRYDEGVYASVGVHPSEVNLESVKRKAQNAKQQLKAQNLDFNKFKEFAKSKKVRAVGEIGLDYKYLSKNKEEAEKEVAQQKELFSEQIKLAQELNLPMIIHCRDAFADLVEVLEKEKRARAGFDCLGVVHCFTGDLKQAEKFIEMGFYIGFTGIIFRESEKEKLEEVIRNIPLDKILVETDCPFLTPPMAGEKRNEPSFVKYVAQRIAEIKGVSFAQIAETTTENAKTLFNF